MKVHHLFGRVGLPVMLFVMLAGLIPAQPSFARPLAVTPATAVNMSAAEVRDLLWVTSAMHRIPADERAETAAYMLVLQQLYRENATVAGAVAAQEIQAIRTAYEASSRSDQSRQARTPNENLFAVFAVLTAPPLSTSPIAGAINLAAREAFALTLERPVAGYDFGDDRIAAATELHVAQLAEVLETLLADSLVLGKRNAQFRSAFDQLWQADLGVSMLAGTATIIQNSPVLRVLPQITQLIKSDGTVQTTVGNLQTLAKQEFTSIGTVIKRARAMLVSLDAQQKDLQKYAADATKRAQNEAAAKAQAEQDKKDLEQAKAALEAVSKLLGKVDPKYGKTWSTMTTALDTIANAISEYTKTVAEVGALSKLGAFAALGMTGSIIGAALTVFALFNESGPTPEQMILEEIGKLRQQVDQLRTEMHGRFDRIDQSLNVIYATLIDRFNKIDIQLGRLTMDLHEIQTSLVEIQKSMHRFEKNMYDIISDGFRRSLWDKINGCIGYEQRTGVTMAYQPEYVDCENVFQTWATIHSFDQLATGPSGRPLGDDQLWAELDRYPLDTNINYVAQFVSERWGLSSFAPNRLANPRDWAIGGRAYAELGMDWPAHAVRINPARSMTIDSTGTALRQALRSISTVNTPDGPRGNRQYFDRAITNYREKATSLLNAIVTVENSYLATLQHELTRTATINLWGGTSQVLDPADRTPLSEVVRCDGTWGPVASPSNLLSTWFPASAQVAHYFAQGTATACYTAIWEEHRFESYGPPYRRIDKTFAKLRVEITSKWDNGELHKRYVQLPEIQIAYRRSDVPSSNWFLDPYDEARRNWTADQFLKSKFEAGGTQSFNDDVLSGTITDKAKTALREAQQNLYTKVIEEFRGVGEVAARARRLTGAKAILDALVMLGLPRALETDEYMRSLIFGSQRLLDQDDDERLTLLYAAAWNTLPAGNVRLTMTRMINGRLTDLDEAIENHLAMIDAGTYLETHRLLETTLDRSTIVQRLARTPVASVSSSSITFIPQFTGTTSPVQSVTLTSNGLATPLSNIAISVAGTNPGDFVQSNTCGTTLAINARCTITIRFKPTATGARRATLNIASNAPGRLRTVALSGTGTVPAPAGNLVLNPGFELDADANNRPDRWTIDSHVTRSNLVKRSGSYAMRHSATADVSYSIGGPTMAGLVPGAPYVVSTWVKIPAPASPDTTGFIFQVEVQWYDAAGALIATTPLKTYTALTPAAGDLASATMIAPARAASATMRMMTASLKGDIYVDDVFFGNLLTNSGFELDRNNDGKPDDWTADARVTRSNAAVRNGDYAMRHAATDNANYTVSNLAADVVAGTRYNVGGYVRIPTTTDVFSVKLEVQWRNAANALVSTTPIKTYTAHTNGAWNLANTNVTAPTGATKAVIRVVVTSLKAEFFMDSFTLRP